MCVHGQAKGKAGWEGSCWLEIQAANSSQYLHTGFNIPKKYIILNENNFVKSLADWNNTLFCHIRAIPCQRYEKKGQRRKVDLKKK